MGDTLVIELGADGTLPTTCWAAEPIAAVRAASHRVGTEVPGVLCRVVHEPMDLDSDPRSPGVFCCHPDGGWRDCPIWLHEQSVLAATGRSMGDPAVADRENAETEREDITGSRYGDVSFLDQLVAQADEAVQDMRYGEDGFVRGEGGG